MQRPLSLTALPRALINPATCSGLRPARARGGIEGFAGMRIAPCTDDRALLFLLSEMVVEAGGTLARTAVDVALVEPEDPECIERADAFTGGAKHTVAYEWIDECTRCHKMMCTCRNKTHINEHIS